MITGVVGITLWTADLDGMFRFYHDVSAAAAALPA